MKVTKNDDWYRAYHTTGPSSNMLAVRFGAGDLEVRGIDLKPGEPRRVEATMVREEVEAALEAFESEAGSLPSRARSVEFVYGDSPRPGIYRALMLAILEHVARDVG